MSVWLAAAFHLLGSSAISFVGAALLTWLGARVLRVHDGRLRLGLALLPFAKLVFELARGIPRSAFFWLRMNEGAKQELGGFKAGFGIDRFTPLVDLSLSAKWRGAQHPQSAADVAAAALTRHLGASAPGVVAAGAIAVGVALVLWFAVRLVRGARGEWRVGAELLAVRPIGLRRAHVLASPSWGGVPFATGLLRPVVCLPACVAALLSAEEREAVIQHELAHLRGLHAVIVVAVGVLERLFWFVPGTGVLAREARAQCEVCADDAAVRAGVDRTLLASALVRVAEIVKPSSNQPPLAFFDRAPVLARRVTRLLASPLPSRSGVIALRAVGLALLAATVLRATTFGNP